MRKFISKISTDPFDRESESHEEPFAAAIDLHRTSVPMKGEAEACGRE